jgi:hypothetical protein
VPQRATGDPANQVRRGEAMSERNVTTVMADDDWLDQALADVGREHRAAYIDDDGFTARVAAALPAPATLPAWRKPAVALLWTAAAAGVALALPPALFDLGYDAVRLLANRPVSLSNILTAMVGLGLATWAAAAVALRRND